MDVRRVSGRVFPCDSPESNRIIVIAGLGFWGVGLRVQGPARYGVVIQESCSLGIRACVESSRFLDSGFRSLAVGMYAESLLNC